MSGLGRTHTGRNVWNFCYSTISLFESLIMAKKEDTATSTEVVKKDASAVALANQFNSDVGSGFEEADSSSYAIPFLQILQSGSPQCKKSDGAYIKGAEEGMLYNTVTQELYDGDQGLTVIPCHFTNRFIEWQLRESGGGFVKEHLPGTVPATTKDDKNRDILPNGNALVDTRNHYVLIVGADGTLSAALIAMSSTQVKKSKQWMSKMQGIKVKTETGFAPAPMMSRKYKLTTVPESNDKGSWYGFRIELVGPVEDIAEYNEAKAFREAVRSGAAKAQPVAEGVSTEPESF
jgi:hypothetical protein